MRVRPLLQVPSCEGIEDEAGCFLLFEKALFHFEDNIFRYLPGATTKSNNSSDNEGACVIVLYSLYALGADHGNSTNIFSSFFCRRRRIFRQLPTSRLLPLRSSSFEENVVEQDARLQQRPSEVQEGRAERLSSGPGSLLQIQAVGNYRTEEIVSVRNRIRRTPKLLIPEFWNGKARLVQVRLVLG